jgi:hypothetical protein
LHGFSPLNSLPVINLTQASNLKNFFIKSTPKSPINLPLRQFSVIITLPAHANPPPLDYASGQQSASADPSSSTSTVLLIVSTLLKAPLTKQRFADLSLWIDFPCT